MGEKWADEELSTDGQRGVRKIRAWRRDVDIREGGR